MSMHLRPLHALPNACRACRQVDKVAATCSEYKSCHTTLLPYYTPDRQAVLHLQCRGLFHSMNLPAVLHLPHLLHLSQHGRNLPSSSGPTHLRVPVRHAQLWSQPANVALCVTECQPASHHQSRGQVGVLGGVRHQQLAVARKGITKQLRGRAQHNSAL